MRTANRYLSEICIKNRVFNYCVEKIKNREDISLKLSAGNCIEGFVLVDGKNKSIEQITAGQEIQIQLFPLKLTNEKYFETVDELLKFASQNYPDNRFYVHSITFDSNNNARPKEIQNYEATTQLIAFLICNSDY